MRFDGSGSRGDGLSYFIEFGDGQVSTEPVAVHPIEEAGIYTARLTVIDRFGRVDRESMPVVVRSLEGPNYYGWYTPEVPRVFLTFLFQQGPELSGSVSDGPSSPSRFTGALSGEQDVRLVFEDSGFVLAGTHRPPAYSANWRMDLTQVGGAENGRRLLFHYYEGPFREVRRDAGLRSAK